MRILHLRLKNLNSLVGEWSIDFTHPDYESNGIFAIIGPTGAGKSTLLDAICLALYGKTPRLDKISKSSNEIMARQTGECFAELTFETARGKYRCLWAQHRSHKKAGGELQSAQREIVDAVTNTVLESHLNRVEAKIEEITGMDFQRFTRSMLLAQGSFDVFLKASPSERAPILEQITGTEIYSKISIGVFERAKKEIKRLEDLHNELAVIQLLSQEDEKSHSYEYQEKSEASASLVKKLQILNEHKTWRSESDRITLVLNDLGNRWNDYNAKEEKAHTDLKKLEQALKALNFEGDFRDLCSLKKRQEDDLENLSSTIAEKNTLEKSLSEKNTQLITGQKEYEELLNKQTQELDIIKRVREIDKDEKIERKRLDELSACIAKEEENAAIYKQAIEDLQKKDEIHKKHLKDLQLYFENYSNNESLVEKFSSIKDNLERFKEKKKLIESKKTEYASSLEQLDEAKKQVTTHRKAFDAAKTSTGNAESLLKTSSDDCEVISGGSDFFQWDEERKALERQEKLFGELKSTLELHKSCEVKKKTILELMQSFKENLKTCREKEEGILRKKEKSEQKIEELLRQQELKNRMQSLEEERTRLCDDNPCPLCGSLEHPYAHGNISDLCKVDEQLHEAKLESKEQEKAYHGLVKEISEIETEIRSCTKNQEEEIKSLSKCDKKKLELLEQLDSNKENFPTIEAVTRHHESIGKQLKEFKQKYDTYLKKLSDKENAQKTYNKEHKKYCELETKLSALMETQNKCTTHSVYLIKEQVILKNDHEELESSLLEAVRVYGIFTFAATDPDVIKQDLWQRLTQWKQQQNAKKQVEEDLQKELLQITIQKGHQERTDNSLKNLRDEKIQCVGCIEELYEKRQHLFGSKNPDKEEEILKKLVESAREKLDALKNEYRRIQQQQENLENSILGLSKISQERAQTLQTKEKKFTEQIYKVGFSGLDAYKQASLDLVERESLSKLKSSLEKQKMELLAEKKTAEDRLSELNQDPKTKETLTVLEEQIQETTQWLDSVKERVFSLKKILSENEKKQEKAKDVQNKIVQQNKETDSWKGLCSLIGSADGKKFRDFAQKMTLEMMIAHANRQLVKMSDRYLLRQSKAFPLELEVVDNYQAGEERSVKNLSGGEGFIVSLSLALGLSQMSSSKVRVDSLFLDEGFGTLDERALEVALDTLSELHQDGKVIGIISHMTILKERISTQIKVQPISGGRSRIEGPGCSEVKR
jgi:DNA repair protein SbcC/Rad50